MTDKSSSSPMPLSNTETAPNLNQGVIPAGADFNTVASEVERQIGSVLRLLAEDASLASPTNSASTINHHSHTESIAKLSFDTQVQINASEESTFDATDSLMHWQALEHAMAMVDLPSEQKVRAVDYLIGATDAMQEADWTSSMNAMASPITNQETDSEIQSVRSIVMSQGNDTTFKRHILPMLIPGSLATMTLGSIVMMGGMGVAFPASSMISMLMTPIGGIIVLCGLQLGVVAWVCDLVGMANAGSHHSAQRAASKAAEMWRKRMKSAAITSLAISACCVIAIAMFLEIHNASGIGERFAQRSRMINPIFWTLATALPTATICIAGRYCQKMFRKS